MVQILQITLREAQFKNQLSSSTKALVKVKFGEIDKSYPTPRNIKDQICRFYGERISLSSQQFEPITKAQMFILLIENQKTTDCGSIEIDLKTIKQQKDSTKVSFNLQNQFYKISFQVLTSNYGGMSEIDNKSERSEISSPLRPQSLTGQKGKSQPAFANILQYNSKQKISTEDKLSQNNYHPSANNVIENLLSKPFNLNRKTRTSQILDQDRKSQNSQRPVKNSRPSSIKQYAQPTSIRVSRQNSIQRSNKSIVNNINFETKTPAKTNKLQEKQLKPNSVSSKKVRVVRQPKVLLKQETPEGILQTFMKNTNIQYGAIIIISFIVGIIFKKL